MNIQLDSDLLKSVVAEAILKSLDEKKRDALIQGAIQYLLTPSTTPYNRKSPIETAFEQGVISIASKIAEETLSNDEKVKARIRGLLEEALVRISETNREQTVAKLADAITAGMAYKERY